MGCGGPGEAQPVPHTCIGPPLLGQGQRAVAGGTDNRDTINDKVEIIEVEISVVDVAVKKITRQSAMNFNEADVKKPLASAVDVAKAGNRIVMEADGGYIENVDTGDRMKLRVEKNVFVYDIQMEDGSAVAVTLDSGAGCNVWPRGLAAAGSMLRPPRKGMSMFAANGTPINHFGQRLVKFRGMEAAKATGFARQA